MPPAQPLLYVENNVGVAFTEAFNKFSGTHGWGAQFQHWVHPGMQRPQKGDEWWIEDIARKGFALLTCDMAITNSDSEREAVRRSGSRFAGFLLPPSTTDGSRCELSRLTGRRSQGSSNNQGR